MAIGSNPTTYNPYDLYKLYKNGAKFGSYTARHLNLSGDFSLSEDSTNNFYNLGVSKSRIVKPASYIIYIDPDDGSVNAVNGTKGTIDYNTNSAPANEADTGTLFNNVNTALSPTGGLVFIRNGTYVLPVQFSVGKSDGSLPLVPIIIRGEGMDITTLKFSATATPASLVQLYCNAIIDNLTVNGNGNSLGLIHTNTPSYTTVKNVHFLNNGGTAINLQTFTNNSGTGSKGQSVIDCWFDKTNTGDQCAIGTVEYFLIQGCFFDKRTAGSGANGSTLGSSLTSGSSNNINILGNHFYRNTADQSPCISLEPYGWAYDRLVIANNTFENGKTIIGGTGNWTAGGNLQSTTYRNVVINGNTGKGHIMIVQGPNIALGGHIQEVIISNNTLSLSDTQDIFLTHVQGPISINNNSLRDSNTGAHGGGGNGLLVVDTCNTVEVTNNLMHMTTANTDNAMKYQFVSGLRFFDNNIFVENGNTGTGIITPGAGSNTNVQLWDNQGYLTNNEGSNVITGNGTTTAFTIPHGLSITPIVYFAQSDSLCYVSSADGTNITVTFPTAPATGSHTVNWRALKKVFA